MSEPLVQDCRGIILDELNNWEVVAMAFRKFFNFGESLAGKIDWSTASVLEKLDGSLCTLYAYDGSWQVSTTGQADAGGRVNKAGIITFADYFWETFHKSGMVLPPPECGTCFFFELTGPMNRVVVEHTSPKLTILGCRNLSSLEEAPPTVAARLLQCPSPDLVVKSFSIRSLDALIASFDTINPIRQEGYVVVDGQWNRIKVKHPGYVALHHALSLRGVGRLRAFAEIARSNEAAEVVASFPALSDTLAEVVRRYERLVAAVAADVARLAACPDQRSFALEATKAPWAPALFRLRAGKDARARDALRALRIDALVELLGMKEADGGEGLGWAAGEGADGEPGGGGPPTA